MLKKKIIHLTSKLYTFFYRITFSRNSKNQIELLKQIGRHFEHLGLDNSKYHTKVMCPEFIKLIPSEKRHNARVLLIGCCNMIEVNSFLKCGFSNLIGIDLVSFNPKYIKIMDMHNMKFGDNEFDLVYISGAYHCTHNYALLNNEICRVIKPGGLFGIVVPVNFQRSEIYQYDVKSIENLCLNLNVDHEVNFYQTDPPNSKTNPHCDEIIRAIITIKK
jgi:SAM-dependent methyltransferase